MDRYGKALASVLGAVLVTLYATLGGDNHIDAEEVVQIGIAAATAAGVYLVPLAPRYRWGKTVVAVVLAILQALTTAVLGGLDSGEWIVLVLAGLTAAGVGFAPARSDNGISSKTPVVADGM